MPRHSSLARLLQVTALAQLALALGWAFWRWPVAPLQAIAGMAFVALVGPLVLAFEFAMSAWVSRGDRAPRASAAQLVLAWLEESAHLFRAFWWRQPFRWRAVADHLDADCAGRTGVVFVHGFMCNRGFWNAWMRRLREQGRAYVAVNLESVFTPIDGYAPIIDEAVARVARATGRPPVVICHSMGGLAARAWWRASGGVQPVARLVTIGSPHGGTWMGRLSLHDNGRQMRLASEWLQGLRADEAAHPLPQATCWYSNCDNMVFPTSTATLAHADNRFVPGQAHVALAFQREVMEGTLALLERADTGRQGESVTGYALENG